MHVYKEADCSDEDMGRHYMDKRMDECRRVDDVYVKCTIFKHAK